MHKVGDKVLYGTVGVMVIADIREECVYGLTRSYYVLRELSGRGGETLIPTDSDILVSRMRPLLTREEIDEIIRSAKSAPGAEWIKDNRTRAEKFKKIILSGNRAELITMIHSIYIEGVKRTEAGKKNYLSDENAMRKAEKLLYSEISVVCGIPEQDVPEYIKKLL